MKAFYLNNMLTIPFIIERSIRVPGLGLLVLPTAVPRWLASYPIHTVMALCLHRLDQPPLPLVATIEEVEYDLQATTRGLLIESIPTDTMLAGSWLVLGAIVTDKLV